MHHMLAYQTEHYLSLAFSAPDRHSSSRLFPAFFFPSCLHHLCNVLRVFSHCPLGRANAHSPKKNMANKSTHHMRHRLKLTLSHQNTHTSRVHMHCIRSRKCAREKCTSTRTRARRVQVRFVKYDFLQDRACSTIKALANIFWT